MPRGFCRSLGIPSPLAVFAIKAASEAALAEEAAAKEAKEAAVTEAQLEMLRQLNTGSLRPDLHSPLIEQLHAKLALTRRGQGTKPDDDGTSTASWQRVENSVSSQTELLRKNGDVHA